MAVKKGFALPSIIRSKNGIAEEHLEHGCLAVCIYVVKKSYYQRKARTV